MSEHRIYRDRIEPDAINKLADIERLCLIGVAATDTVWSVDTARAHVTVYEQIARLAWEAVALIEAEEAKAKAAKP